MSRRTSRVYDVETALDGIRQTARCRRDARFDNLLHHIYAVERLEQAYFAVKRDAAAGAAIDDALPQAREVCREYARRLAQGVESRIDEVRRLLRERHAGIEPDAHFVHRVVARLPRAPQWSIAWAARHRYTYCQTLGAIKTVAGSGRVVEVRDEYMPVIELEKVFDVPRFDFEHVSSIMVVVEAEGGRVALLVDELLGQQQVVVKNLEANYRKVNDVSGATIMGDGRVALILDVGSLVRRSRH